MLTSFIAVLSLAAVMAAPTSPKNHETLRNLVDPSPELLSRLNQVSSALTGSSSLATSSPEVSLGREIADLNLMNGLNNIILRILKGIFERLTPETPTQSRPADPSGNDIFNTGPSPGTGSGVNPPTPAMTPSFFNPLLRLFFPGSRGPFNMFYSSMMSELFDGFGELM